MNFLIKILYFIINLIYTYTSLLKKILTKNNYKILFVPFSVF